MRIGPFLLSAALTAGFIFVLDRPHGKIPALGRFISPQYGFWQNAEPADFNYNESIAISGIKGNAEVYLDDRLVPHVFAENEEDLYFIQGYLHAKFRLFQIDLQTRAAAGRASELAGSKAIAFDREQRRLGMVYAAENALREIEKDPASKTLFNAYTDGVNSYIDQLTEAQLPIEYKLMGVKPDRWSNLRSTLLLKMMAKLLSSGTESDLAHTNAKSIFMPDELLQLYPQVPDSLMPIIPKGTVFPTPAVVPIKPASADSLYLLSQEKVEAHSNYESNPDNGSNNWVVAGSKTQSGVPILASDPHLELSLPSIWYEIQLKTPQSNVYGVSLPGCPFVIIGFNDSIAWGVTNSQRDVKDYYEIQFKDASRKEYWFQGQWVTAPLKIEEIKVKDSLSFFDTVAYTVFGPVQFDDRFSNAASQNKNLAVRWTAHDPSNEGRTFYKLNRAKNYADYEEAISTFECPGQNFVFASKTGDIAIWQQGKFPARWDRQGLYIMPGEDSTYMWQDFIPQKENPHAFNPERGYLQSANQRAVDSTYPYFIPGSYITARGITIDNRLASMTGITPIDMMRLQYDYFNTTAEDLRPVLLRHLNTAKLSPQALRYLEVFRNWDLQASPDSKGQTVYQCFWDSVQAGIWRDDISRSTPQSPMPTEQTTLELLLKDSTLIYADDVSTPSLETLSDVITSAFQKATEVLTQKEAAGNLNWEKYMNPSVYHLLKDAMLPFARRGLHIGGYNNIINAVKHSHGPSWRMIVHLTAETEAYGVFPGGQSGNPGSRFYDNNISVWEKGEYNRCWMMQEKDKSDSRVQWVIKFTKA